MPRNRGNRRGGAGSLEAEVMAVLWASDAPLAVKDVLEALNATRTEPLAYTTVMTVLGRLEAKRALTRGRVGRGYVYEPRAADEAGLAVRHVLDSFGDAAVARFVDEARADPDVMARLRRLLEQGE